MSLSLSSILRHPWFRCFCLLLVLGLALPEPVEAARKRSSSSSRKYTKSKGGKGKGKKGKRGRRARRDVGPKFAVPPIQRGFSTVVIDAGHGGHDNGGIRQNLASEKELALDTAIRLQKILSRAGLRTVMTRSDDTFIPLGTRVAIANSTPNSVFISIHYNASFNPDARGFETYFSHPSAYPLAARIHRNLLATRLSEDRFLRRRGFYVVRNLKVSGVLCELGFLTNADEARNALNRSFRQKCAEAIAEAVFEVRRSGGE
ncbi:MAG: N-acetylmuramoyl-L-alanine amidase [Verrucomicrobia bacterium]|nr:N-acetylmuramoyl-L-alanine amidase [Verrucomicrobiota bacterium]